MLFHTGSIYHKRKNWVTIKEYVSVRYKCFQQYMARNKISWVKIVGISILMIVWLKLITFFSRRTKKKLTDTDSDGSADSDNTIILPSKKSSLPSPPNVDDQLPPLKRQNATAVATTTHGSPQVEASSTSVRSKSEGNIYSLLPHLTKRWKGVQY